MLCSLLPSSPFFPSSPISFPLPFTFPTQTTEADNNGHAGTVDYYEEAIYITVKRDYYQISLFNTECRWHVQSGLYDDSEVTDAPEQESQLCSFYDFLLYSRKYTRRVYYEFYTTSTCTALWHWEVTCCHVIQVCHYGFTLWTDLGNTF